MKSFRFHRPASLGEAAQLLRQHEAAKLLAGGQSLLPVLKLDLAEPSDLVSLAAISELRGIRAHGDYLEIGARATHDEVSRSPLVQELIPGLAGLAAGIGDAQVRNRGTLGGSLAHADPAADYPAAVLALGATIVTDRRRIAGDDFFTGLFSTALAADEIITAVHFPVPERSAYAKFPHRASKYAVVGVMVAHPRRQAAASGGAGPGPGASNGGGGPFGGIRVAVTGAGQKAFRVPALEAALDRDFTPNAVDAVAAGVVAPAELRADGEASAEFRAHLVTVMAKRATQACQ